jgi:hypothetical protein
VFENGDKENLDLRGMKKQEAAEMYIMRSSINIVLFTRYY